jgi:hypothetical protein
MVRERGHEVNIVDQHQSQERIDRVSRLDQSHRVAEPFGAAACNGN